MYKAENMNGRRNIFTTPLSFLTRSGHDAWCLILVPVYEHLAHLHAAVSRMTSFGQHGFQPEMLL